MRTFEYDLSHYGGNYADVGTTVLIPEELLERGGKYAAMWRAFELVGKGAGGS